MIIVELNEDERIVERIQDFVSTVGTFLLEEVGYELLDKICEAIVSTRKVKNWYIYINKRRGTQLIIIGMGFSVQPLRLMVVGIGSVNEVALGIISLYSQGISEV